MKKILFAALLAGTAMPASATTYVHYQATGKVTQTVIDQVTLKVLGTAVMDLTVNAWMNPASPTCFFPTPCQVSGSSINFSILPTGATAKLTFDHTLTGVGIPLTADSFVGGTFSNFYAGPGNNQNWFSGTLTALTVELVEGNPLGETFGGWRYSATPEPTTWALMVAGFGLAGAALRRRGRLALA
jgi:hypothetical protein